MGTLSKITRRTFLVVATAAVGGVAFGYYKYKQPFANPLEDDLAEGEATFNPYIKIADDNSITVIAPRAEMGQGIFTTLGALVAEELDVTLDQITIEHGPASPAYYSAAALEHGAPFAQFDESFTAETVRSAMGVVAKFLALQLTGGSASTVDHYQKMRLAGATAREMLKAAAAETFSVSATTLMTADGVVTDPASGRGMTYGALARDAAKLTPPDNIRLKYRVEWKILGKSPPRKDMLAKVTGGRIFGIDVAEENMLHATVRMNPHLGGKMLSLDTAAAEDMRGVRKVVEIRSRLGEGFGVIADNTWRAFQAADAVVVEWGRANYPETMELIEAELDRKLDDDTGFSMRTLGDPDAVIAAARPEQIMEAEYFAPFLSHAAMEPMNATARFSDGWLDIWAPHQSPTIVKLAATEVAGVAEDRVRVHITFLGGGFGRRAEPDFIDYAVRLAMEVPGSAVKVTWTREEDMTHSPMRPIAKSRYKAVIGDDGFPKAVTGSIASPSITESFVGRVYPSLPIGGPDVAIIDGAYNQPYMVENYRVDGKPVDLDMPTTFWRSVGSSYNAFMHESFIDEMASRSKLDPLELRRKLMAPYPVAIALIDAIALMSDWDSGPAPGRARGFAFTLSFGTWVAQIVEVSQQEAGIRVERVFCAVDAGTVLDERNFRAQMMSGIIYGLSAAIGQKITFSDGMVEQANFQDFDGMRMYQCPAIEIELLSNSKHMGGAGEPATPPVMPALANAIHALTGERIRRMPLGDTVTFV